MAHPSASLPVLGIADAVAIVGEPVYSVTPVGHGARSRVYRVETDEGAVRIVRVTPKGSGRIAREAWVRSQLRRNADAPIPAEVTARAPGLADVADVVTMAELPGTTLYAAQRSLFEPDVCALYQQFGAGLGAIHAVPVQGFGLIDAAGRGGFGSHAAAFDALAAAALEEARVSPLVGEVDAAVAALASLRGELPELPAASLLHGDPGLTNVQVHRGRVVAFFDFEFALGGDRLYELAAVEALFEPAPGDRVGADDLLARRAAFYQGYARHHAPPGPESARRLRLYRLVHALRGAEFLSVVGPQLSAPLRAQSVDAQRTNLRRWLDP